MRLNEYHGRSYSNRYWRILLMPWLVNLVMCAFERFLRIRNRVRSGVPYLVYLAPNEETFSAITTPHFNQMMIDDPLNRLIFSRFIRAFRPQGWVLREGVAGPGRFVFFIRPLIRRAIPEKTMPFSRKRKEKWRCIVGRAFSPQT